MQRRLGTVDAVTIGVGSMIGAGIFVALAPAAAAAAVVALTVVNYAGIEKSALLTRVIVAVVLAVLVLVGAGVVLVGALAYLLHHFR